MFEPIQFDHQLVWNFLDRFGKYYPVSCLSRKILKRGKPGECFRNSLSLCHQYPDHFAYVEGLAGFGTRGTLHAWNRLREREGIDRFVDRTWAQDCILNGPWYCGVEFDPMFVEMTMATQRKELGPRPGGYSMLTFEPLLLGRVEPFLFGAP